MQEVINEGDLVMLFQKDTGKLQPRWRSLFKTAGFGSSRQILYTLRQSGGRKIKGTFYRNYLKLFIPRTEHLAEPSPISLPQHQTIQQRRPRARTKA